ncbi:PAS domain S-box protein, partial [bacterium]|nr:PAS domain S-box protein [bacterium]
MSELLVIAPPGSPIHDARDLLQSAGVSVSTAADFDEAIDRVAKIHFDVAICDVSVVADVFDFRNALVANSPHAQIILLRNGLEGPPDMRLGICDVMTPPVDSFDVVRRVRFAARIAELSADNRRLAHDLARRTQRVRLLEEDRMWEMQAGAGWYRELITNLPDLVWRTDFEGRVLYASPSVRDLLGITPDETLGRRMSQYMTKESIARTVEWFTQAESADPPADSFRGELDYRRADGSILPVEIHVAIVRNFRGEAVAFEGISRDISWRRNLQAENTRFALGVSQAPHAILFLDGAGNVAYANPAYLAASGFSFLDVEGEPYRALKSERHAPAFLDEIWRHVNEAGSWRGELLNRHRDDAPYLVDAAIARITSARDEIVGYLVIEADARRRAESERVLRESEARYRGLFEGSRDAIIIADAISGRIVDANPAAERLSGYPRGELLRMHHADLHPSDELERYQAMFTEHTITGRVISSEIYIQRADGRLVPVDLSSATFDSGGRLLVQAVFRDLTDRRMARESEGRFLVLAESFSAAILIHQAGRFLYVNSATRRITGYTSEEMRNMYFWEIIHPDEREMVKKRGEQRLAGVPQPTQYRLRIVRKDGTAVPLDFTAGIIDFEGAPAVLGIAFEAPAPAAAAAPE